MCLLDVLFAIIEVILDHKSKIDKRVKTQFDIALQQKSSDAVPKEEVFELSENSLQCIHMIST